MKNTTNNFAAKLAVVRSNLRRLQSGVSALEERLDALLLELDSLVVLSSLEVEQTTPAQSPSPVFGLVEVERRRFFSLHAGAGVRSVKIVSQLDGSALVQIDERNALPISTLLAALLETLAEDIGTHTDQLVAWKSIVSLKQSLGKRTGKSFSDRAVINLVYRLRRTLEIYDENPYLVQYRPGLGYRFAQRRSAVV